MESNGNGNGSSNRHLLEKLSRYSIGEEIPGEDIPPPTPDNECSCAYSAMLLADNWTAALHLLGTNPTQGITEYPKFARQIGYFANQVDQKCGITHDNISGDPLPQGLIYNVHSMGDNPEDFLKRSIDRNTPAGQNALELSEEEVDIKKFTEEEIEDIMILSSKINQEGLEEINSSFAPNV
ncbi:hypothetical protein LCGC14_0854130, partial [marine sediment metagenome]